VLTKASAGVLILLVLLPFTAPFKTLDLNHAVPGSRRVTVAVDPVPLASAGQSCIVAQVRWSLHAVAAQVRAAQACTNVSALILAPTAASGVAPPRAPAVLRV
jgi:hypothetical protein